MCSKWEKIILTIVLTCLNGFASSQTVQGITGLLNAPSAQMQKDGTFMMGGNFLPSIITPDKFNYNTANYYFNITFLPFFEVNYKMTLFSNGGKYNQQDRSIAIRGRIINEGDLIPSIVIGANDIYSQTIGAGNQYFGVLYAAATKHFKWNKNIFSPTIGYDFSPFRHQYYQGVFGGFSFSPSFSKHLNLIAEYDSDYWNVGGSCLIFNHVNLILFICDFKEIVCGIAYKVYLENN